ncbi:unnamed protein product [Meloidogyne enterolobii]|uniref:Uncharacterized protein n=1 Tax=Meloidogyne enterolobii TaxID=390850 RepID=A0ACB1AVQ8_MELEN
MVEAFLFFWVLYLSNRSVRATFGSNILGPTRSFGPSLSILATLLWKVRLYVKTHFLQHFSDYGASCQNQSGTYGFTTCNRTRIYRDLISVNLIYSIYLLSR